MAPVYEAIIKCRIQNESPWADIEGSEGVAAPLFLEFSIFCVCNAFLFHELLLWSALPPQFFRPLFLNFLDPALVSTLRLILIANHELEKKN